ncbi:hypothetical protein [Rhodococcus sp. IEGM 1408]|uniref:hypothetical protein n=1 Tax=Rhodococcus sp. IEGM 1408 TaxID=3082220 RepID=UPI002955CB52|nr:hypothetical protein [Rhodococcus sp. IEGM 1408]MDV8001457.1 hypothetical protein [Rhodococcus sp. IEGM 1408]
MSRTLGKSLRKTRGHLQITLVLAGIVTMLATLALGAATIRPTEAAWQDTARGGSVFGMANPNAGKNYARAISGHGVIERQVTSSTTTPARVLANTSAPSPAVQPLNHSDSGLLWALPLEMAGRSCATVDLPQPTRCGTSKDLSPGTSFASSEVNRLRLWQAGFKGNELLAYGTSDNQSPISATATCVPGQVGRARVSAGGPIILKEKAELFLPRPNHQTSATHDKVTGVLQYHQSEGPGWAKAEARLYVTSREAATNFTLHVTLASAECGLARATPDEAPRPTTAAPSALPESPNQPSEATAASPLSLRSIVEVAEEQVAEEQAADDQSGDDLEAVDDVEEVEVIAGEAALPSLDEAAAATPRTETAIPGSATSAPATSAPATSTPAILNPSDPSAALATTAPTAEETAVPETVPAQAATPTTTEQAAEQALEQAAEQAPVADGPQQPASVRVGREFAVVNRAGVELGIAKVQDIVRTPGCGVELSLSVTTSAEAGSDRWASIGPDDFAEIRSSGMTREAKRINSDCEQASSSRTTALSPGRDYEIVISFLIEDSAQQAMLRPDGTAGWTFDLPPMPRVAVTSSPAAAPAASPSATSPSATSPSATSPSAATSAARAETAVKASIDTTEA